MKQFKGVIYQAINIQNNKSYIGKTLQEFEEYKQGHIYSALHEKDLKTNPKGKYFYNAVRKYGVHNFKWIILGEIFASSKKELKKLLNKSEIESIWLFRTFGASGEKFDNIYGYNCTKGGDGGWAPLSQESMERRIETFKETKSNIPDYEEKKKHKEMETKRNDPSIMKNAGKKTSKTKKDNPGIIENQVKNLKITLDQNPEIKLNANKKLSENWENKTPEEKQEKINNIKQAFKDNPDIIVKQKEKEMKTKTDDPSIMKRAGEKGRKKRIEDKVNVGKSHARYVELDISFILQYYFDITEINELFELYNKNHDHILRFTPFYRFIRILQIPVNRMKWGKQKEIYLDFVRENKHKIQWYIDNYERLEEEYFLQMHYNKHEDFFTNK